MDKDLLDFFGSNSMSELQMKYIPFIPFEIRYAHRTPPIESYIV